MSSFITNCDVFSLCPQVPCLLIQTTEAQTSCRTAPWHRHQHVGKPCCLWGLCQRFSEVHHIIIYLSPEALYSILSHLPDTPTTPLWNVNLPICSIPAASGSKVSVHLCLSLSSLRHLQISAGLQFIQRSEWPRLQYILREIARSQKMTIQCRLPITAVIMQQLQLASLIAYPDSFKSELLWAACCLCYFGSLRLGEFIASDLAAAPSLSVSDVAVDSHDSLTFIKLKLHWAKTDPFRKGVDIFLIRSGTTLCPVVALLRYLAIRPKKEGTLLIHADGTPLSRDQFVRKAKKTLCTANIDDSAYCGHSFQIVAITIVARVSTHFIKMLGGWESDSYQLYNRTPHESLTAVPATSSPRLSPPVQDDLLSAVSFNTETLLNLMSFSPLLATTLCAHFWCCLYP